MTLRTWAFAIGFRHSSTPVAHALICPDVQYVAIRWHDGRLDRRHVPEVLWPALNQELNMDLAAGPVSSSSMMSTVLVGSMGALMTVTYIDCQSVNVSLRTGAESVLDDAIRSHQLV